MFTGQDLRDAIKDTALPLLQGRLWNIAILVSRPAQYGAARQFGVFAEPFSNATIHDDRGAAIAWVTTQPTRP